MKKLFIIRRHKNGPMIPDLYFSDKMEAKKKRNELGDNHVVSYGPDHKKFIKSGE
jgi:hypothetical protein